MKLNFNIDFKSIVQILLKKFSVVLWIFLGLVIIAEGFVIKDSLNKILTATDQSQFAGAQLIRVNFSAYDMIEKQLDENSKFLPNNPENLDPFGVRGKN